MKSEEYAITDEIIALEARHKRLRKRRINATREYFKNNILKQCANFSVEKTVANCIETFVYNISCFKCSYDRSSFSNNFHIKLSTQMFFPFEINFAQPFELYFKGGYEFWFVDPLSFDEFAIDRTNEMKKMYDKLSKNDKLLFYKGMGNIQNIVFNSDVLEKTHVFFQKLLNTRYFEDRYNIYLIIHDCNTNINSVFLEIPSEIIFIIFKFVLKLNSESIVGRGKEGGEEEDVRLAKKCKY